MDLAILTNDGGSLIEAIFRIADTLQWFTPMFLTCELSARFVSIRIFAEVYVNMKNPQNYLFNVIAHQFEIISDFFVMVANVYYSDPMSVAFWMGDLYYQIAVI